MRTSKFNFLISNFPNWIWNFHFVRPYQRSCYSDTNPYLWHLLCIVHTSPGNEICIHFFVILFFSLSFSFRFFHTSYFILYFPTQVPKCSLHASQLLLRFAWIENVNYLLRSLQFFRPCCPCSLQVLTVFMFNYGIIPCSYIWLCQQTKFPSAPPRDSSALYDVWMRWLSS
jgi:hypothetical protein